MWVFISTSSLNLEWNVLIEVYQWNIATPRNQIRKHRRVSIAFLDNRGYFSLILYQNSTDDGFLKVTCNMEFETKSMDFFILNCIKLHWFILHCGSFTNAWSVISCSGHLENSSSLSYAGLPNADTFHLCTVKRDTCCYHHQSYQKVFKYWEVVRLMRSI